MSGRWWTSSDGRLAGAVDGAAGGVKSGPTAAQPDAPTATRTAMSGTPGLRMAVRPERLRELRRHALEKRAQLARLGFGDAELQVVMDLPRQVIDALDDRQGLGGERQDMNTAIIGVGHAREEAG